MKVISEGDLFCVDLWPMSAVCGKALAADGRSRRSSRTGDGCNGGDPQDQLPAASGLASPTCTQRGRDRRAVPDEHA